MWLRIELADDSKLKDGLRADLQDMQHMVDQFIGFVRGTDPAAYRYASMALQDWLGERARLGAGTDIRLHGRGSGPGGAGGRRGAGPPAGQPDRQCAEPRRAPVDVTLHQEGRHAVLDGPTTGRIAPERRREALRPFSRLDDARTRTGSVGLGLALAEAIAAHGGSLNCCRPRRRRPVRARAPALSDAA